MSEHESPLPLASQPEDADTDRRAFLKKSLPVCLVLLTVLQDGQSDTGKTAGDAAKGEGYKAADHLYGMGINPSRCIGCGRCADACKTENDVPREPYYFRTWIERYVIQTDGETVVSSPEGGIAGFPPVQEKGILRTFFVPKLCNQCASPPCVQVCPVGATFSTQDGVVLVDKDYCIGCRYCIQACPYGARFLHPQTHTAEKCTFCYHRLVQGLVPACVEVCPTQARIFGEVRRRSSPLTRFMRMNEIQTLKPHMNTEPKVYYANLDGEVR
jgi:Fe-S-cluster-containing dehydrogenase component